MNLHKAGFAAWIGTAVLIASCIEPEQGSPLRRQRDSGIPTCCYELYSPGAELGLCIAQARHGLGPCAVTTGVDAGPDSGEPDADVDAGSPEAGSPEAGCTLGSILCDGICVDPLTNNSNCGACDLQCPEDMHCAFGECILCSGGGLQMCNGKCSFLLADPLNCGACGAECPSSTPYCDDGQCSSCLNGEMYCDGRCVHHDDPNNCGSCGHVCPAETPSCWGGVCECSAGTTLCDTRCVDTSNDPANCGDCGVVCENGQICFGGYCGSPDHCLNGLRDADETDVDCGRSCSPCADLARCTLGTDCRSGHCTATGRCYRARPTVTSCQGQPALTPCWTPDPCAMNACDYNGQCTITLSSYSFQCMLNSCSARYCDREIPYWCVPLPEGTPCLPAPGGPSSTPGTCDGDSSLCGPLP